MINKRFSWVILGLGLIIGSLVALTASCSSDSKSANTDVVLSVTGLTSQQSAASGAASSPIIAPSEFPRVGIQVKVSSPKFPMPLTFKFSPEEVQANYGILTMRIPTGKARTFDIEVFEAASAPTENQFPGRLWIPSTSALARTFNLTGKPTIINIDMTPAPTVTMVGTISDTRTGMVLPIETCAAPVLYMGFYFQDQEFWAGFTPLTVSPTDPSKYTVYNVPTQEPLVISMKDLSTDAGNQHYQEATYGVADPLVLDFLLQGARPLQIIPPNAVVGTSTSILFQAIGGVKPYNYQFVASPSGGTITIDGAYVSGSSGSVIDVVAAFDSCYSGASPTPASISTANVAVVPSGTLWLVQSPPGTVAVGGVVTILSFGGTPPYNFSISPAGFASINPATGILTGTAAGPTVVMATDPAMSLGSLNVSVSVPVSVSPLSAILWLIPPVTTLQLEIVDALGTPLVGLTVPWASSNTSCATVDATGLVSPAPTATDGCTATITAGAFGSCSITAFITPP